MFGELEEKSKGQRSVRKMKIGYHGSQVRKFCQGGGGRERSRKMKTENRQLDLAMWKSLLTLTRAT